MQIFPDHLVSSESSSSLDQIKKETKFACQTGCIDDALMRVSDESKLEKEIGNEYLHQMTNAVC